MRLASASFLASSAISSLMSRICLWRRLFCSFSRISLLLRWSRSSVSFSKFSLSRAKWLCQQQREMVRDRDWNYKYIDMACRMWKIWCIVMVVKVTFKRNCTNQVSHWCAKNPPPPKPQTSYPWRPNLLNSSTCCSYLGSWYNRMPSGVLWSFCFYRAMLFYGMRWTYTLIVWLKICIKVYSKTLLAKFGAKAMFWLTSIPKPSWWYD